MREDGRYAATWAQGSQAVVEVERFGADGMLLRRTNSAGTTPGMQAVYAGTVMNGDVIRGGTVTWTTSGQTFSGTWYAEW